MSVRFPKVCSHDCCLRSQSDPRSVFHATGRFSFCGMMCSIVYSSTTTRSLRPWFFGQRSKNRDLLQCRRRLSATKNEERRTKNEERRTKNEERRTKNEERSTKHEELRFASMGPSSFNDGDDDFRSRDTIGPTAASMGPSSFNDGDQSASTCRHQRRFASMGPSSFNDGDCPLICRSVPVTDASMGPSSFNDGDKRCRGQTRPTR